MRYKKVFDYQEAVGLSVSVRHNAQKSLFRKKTEIFLKSSFAAKK